jgi:hypothetical protein
MKVLSNIVVLTAVLVTTPAYADMFCVQRELTNLGYAPGPVDGAFGGRTAAAAIAFADDFSVVLPLLDKTNSAPWCDAVTAALATPEGLARRFDVTSPPEGLLSEAATRKMWDLYKHIPECLEFDKGEAGIGGPIPLEVRSADALSSGRPWSSPFTQAIGAGVCTALLPNFGELPASVPVVRLNEDYGDRHEQVDSGMTWFQRASTFVRVSGDPVARAALKAALMEWARDDSLGKGINVSWGTKPIDYQMLAALMGVLAATAEIVPDLTPADRAVLGPWLNRLVKVAANSNWRDRADNKTLMTAYVVLLWGIISDDSAAVREGINAYKLALHFMRPDGSFPVDSQRGGMGIQYSAYNVSYLIQIASAVRQAYGMDLFAYSADGRSIHDAVDFMVRSIKAPGETNAIYAIACPGSGDRWGSISDPSTGFFDDAPTLLVYAEAFPDSENAAWIRENAAPAQYISLSEHSGGAAACQFAPATNAVFSGEPIKVEGIYALPEPKYPLFPTELMAHKIGMEVDVNSLLFSEINIPAEERAKIGIPKISFNIVGKYDYLAKTFSQLNFTFTQDLPVENLDAIKACGRNFDVNLWDDGSYHLIVKMRKIRKEFFAPDLSCVKPLVTEENANMAEFITNNFRDFAIGMVRNNSLPAVSNDGLRQWLEAVALGEDAFLHPPGYEPAS